jgi:two-component system sensor histidine kinase YesM
LTFFLTKRNYNNLLSIITTFESAENGEPLPALPSRVNDEYSFILQNVIKTFIEQSYLKVQLSEKKYRLKTMEFVALQSQINPHFLFNTLKTIFWKSISLTGDQNEVSNMIEHLSDILHYSLGNYEKTVTLAEEIKSVQSYIEIQKVRYKDKFRVIWQYDDALTKYSVLKLLLQPLIENCIYHGIKEKEGFSYIKIKMALVKSNILITIIDNGLGIKPDTLSEIRKKLSEDGEYTEHIGLSNTNKRLKLTYGDEYGIVIRSKYGLGTVIYITIPVSEKDESSI